MTRDWKAWPITMWIGLIGAAATYLSMMPPPAQWTWQQWMVTIAGLAAVVAAKLGNSPLKGENDADRVKLPPAVWLLPLILLWPGGLAAQELPISQVRFVGGPDISTFAQTTSITQVSVDPNGTNLAFDKKDGPTRWPDNTTPGWQGSLQYSIGLCLNLDGGWSCSAPIEVWYGRTDATGPIQNQSMTCAAGHGQIQCNWFYASRWAPLNSHQPAPGETVGIFVVAGDARNSFNPVKERSNIVLFALPAEGQTASFNFAAVVPQPSAPPPAPPPVLQPPASSAQPPAPLPSVDLTPILAQLVIIQQKVDALTASEKQWHDDVTSVWKQIGEPVLKYVVSAVTAFLAGKAM